MSLEISQVRAQIGIDRTPGRLEMESRSARLELHQKQAKVNLHTELPKIQIDQYECFASSGLKNNHDFTKEATERAYQQVMEYIGKVADDGDTLAAAESGGNPIADIAERDAYTEHEFGYDYMPKASPKFSVTGSLDIKPERNWEGINNGVEGNYVPGNLNINYTPAIINIYMRQYPSVSFKYQESKVDTYV